MKRKLSGRKTGEKVSCSNMGKKNIMKEKGEKEKEIYV